MVQAFIASLFHFVLFFLFLMGRMAPALLFQSHPSSGLQGRLICPSQRPWAMNGEFVN